MSQTETQNIVLTKLYKASRVVVSSDRDGLEVKTPAPCVQTNAPGSLGRAKDIVSFRKEAVDLGGTYAKVLVG